MPLVVGVAAVVAFIVQLTSGLPIRYTWTFSLEMFRDIAVEPWFPTLAMVCYAVGRSARIDETREAFQAQRDRPVVGLPRGAVCCSAGLVAAVLDHLLIAGHHVADHVAVGAFAASIIFIPPTWSELRERGIELVELFALYTLAAYAHTVFKALIFVGGSPEDSRLIGLERVLFGEPLHRYVAHWASQHDVIVRLASEVYRWNASQIVLVSIVLSGAGKVHMRTEFLASIGLALVIAAPLYHVVPSYGPYFAEPEVFAFLQEIRLSADWYQWLASNTESVVSGNATELKTFQYVAAMPSLHVGFSFTMLLYLRSVPVACVVGVPVMMFAWLATMMLGWHYFIDGVFGIVVAFSAVFVVHRFGNVLLYPRMR